MTEKQTEKQTNAKAIRQAKKTKSIRTGMLGPASEQDRAEWKLSSVREPLIDKALAENDLVSKGTLAEKAARLDAHYRNVVPKDDGSFCDCGFFSDSVLLACPFCGEREVESAEDKKDFDAARARRSGEQPTAAQTEIVVVPTDRTPIVVVPETDDGSSSSKAADLDEAVLRVRQAHAQGLASYWDIGAALLPIFERQLYFQRLNAAGEPLYRSWSQFLTVEFNSEISSGHAHRMMAVAKLISRPDAIAIGVAKASILTRVSEAERPRLIEAAKTLTTEDLRASARQYLEEPGTTSLVDSSVPRRGTGTSAGSKNKLREGREAAAFVAEKTAENKITVVAALGVVEIPLYTKDKAGVRARRMSDDPVGVQTFINGVEQRYFVAFDGAGAMVLKVVLTRAKS